MPVGAQRRRRTSRPGRVSRGAAIVRGGVGPLTPPGIAWAGRELLAGMELAVQDVNAEGGSGGGRLGQPNRHTGDANA